MSKDLHLRLRITADGSGVKGELRTASGEVVRFSDQLEGGAKRGTRALKETEQQTSRLGASTNRLVSRLAAIAAGYISIQGASRLMRTITNNTIRQEAAWAQLEARIASTGGAAGRSIDQIRAMAAQLQQSTTVSNEAIEEMAGILLTFTQITEERFDASTRAVLNVATAMGTGLTSAALQVGKALNDPIRGMDGLNRSGIQFSDTQREIIQGMAQSGDLAGAQTMILAELERQFGGAAEAARNNFGGALKGLKNDFDDLLKFTGDMPGLAAQIEAISARIRDPELRAAVEEGIAAALGLIPPAIDAGVSAIEILVPLLSATADNADKIGLAARALAAILAGRLVASLVAATTAKIAALASTQRYGAALVGLAGMSNTAAAGQLALAAATRTATGALALVGGPVGAVALALAGAVVAARHYNRHIEGLREPSERARDSLERMIQATQGEYGTAQADAFRVALEDLREEIEKVRVEVDALEERRQRLMARGGGIAEQTGGRKTPEQIALEERLAAKEREEKLLIEANQAREWAAQQFGSQAERYELGAQVIADASEKVIGFLERYGLVTRNAAGGIGEMAAASKEFTDPLDAQIEQLREQLILLTEGEAKLMAHQELRALESAQLLDVKNNTNAYTAAVRAHFAQRRDLVAQINAHKVAATAAAEAEQKLRQQAQALTGSYTALLSQLHPVVAEQRRLLELQALATRGGAEWEAALRAAGLSAEQTAEFLQLINEALDDLDVDGTKELADELERLREEADPAYAETKRLNEELATLQKIADAGLINDDEFEALAEHLRNARKEAHHFGDELAYSLRMMQGVFERGSKGYQQLEVAIQAVNAVQAIQAILKQLAEGDVYSAIPRALAVAGIVASLGQSIGGLSGGLGSTVAQDRQETQGTGSVLGDEFAKSESIADATRITADAARELVGINRGMLRNLIALNRAIGGASGMLARGAGDVDFAGVQVPETGPLPEIFAKIGDKGDVIGLFHGIFNSIHKWFGGKSKVVDQGIEILGGTIGELIEAGLIGAYQEVEFRKWRFGGRRQSDEFVDLDDDVTAQFRLIFEAMAASVAAAAEALGIPAADFEAALESYEVAAQKISLMDLSAEEQQAELEAVFSQIFDGLAGHVVPFVEQFQKIGEGLGATLVRVATGVQVTEEAIRRLGFQAERTGAEQFAQLSERLIELAGGLDDYIAGISNFFDKFATDSQRFEVAQDSINRAFEQFGLVVPGTRDGMAALMRTLDATTEEGAEQIAILIALADAADAYYKQLEKIQSEREGLERQILRLEGDKAALRQIEIDALDESNRALKERIFALEDEAELAQIMLRVTEDIARLSMSPLRNEARLLQRDFNDLAARARELGASERDLELMRKRHQLQVDALVARLKESLISIADQLFGGASGAGQTDFGQNLVDPISSAANQIRDSLIRALEGVEAWLIRSELTDASMTSVQQFHAVNDRFAQLIDQALSGDPEAQAAAASELPGMADQLLALAGQMYGTATPEYQEFLAMVREQMGAVAGIDIPDEEPAPTFAQVGAIQSAVEQFVLTALEQTQLAGQFIEELGAVAHLLGRTPFDIADELDLPLREVIAMLVDLQDPTVETVHQLALVANILGVSLPKLADEMGLAIGDLRDESSLLSLALQDVVSELPDEIQEELAGHLAAIAGATTEADANAAIAELEEAVNDLDPAFRNALAPFLQGVSIVDPLMDTLGVLEQIREYDRRQTEAAEASSTFLNSILTAIRAQNRAADIPGFASGGWATGVVNTGERGPELILPHDVSSFFARAGIPVNVAGGMDDRRIVGKLQELVDVERRAFDQRERLGGQQIEVVRDLSSAMIDAERRRASERGLMA